MTRTTLESAAVLLVGTLAKRQLALPKNRGKGCPSEPPEVLLRMAADEIDEVLHAIRTRRGTAAVLAEIGDAVALLGLAAVSVAENDKESAHL